MKNIFKILATLMLSLTLFACSTEQNVPVQSSGEIINVNEFDFDSIPEFDGSTAYVILNKNVPNFTDEEKQSTDFFEEYSPLDDLNRPQAAFANLHISGMPTEERGNISHVKPAGWQIAKYDHVDGKYLYNRCHLIGFQLAGENDNELNLITGTRYMNVEGMLPFENGIADYLKETNNHVLYRVTPVYKGDELIARGVIMEAYSVEDNGDGIMFNVYCYNNQPKVTIDYSNGNNQGEGLITNEIEHNEKQYEDADVVKEYVINTNSKKIHDPECKNVAKISDSNKEIVNETLINLFAKGYEPSQCCIIVEK